MNERKGEERKERGKGEGGEGMEIKGSLHHWGLDAPDLHCRRRTLLQ